MEKIDQLNFDTTSTSQQISQLPVDEQIKLLKNARDKVNPELRKKIDDRLNKLESQTRLIRQSVDVAIEHYITQIKTAQNIQSKINALDNAIGLLDSLGESRDQYLKILLPEIIDNIKDVLPAIAH